MTIPTTASITADYQRDWPAYFDAVHDKPPRETLLKALELFDLDRGSDASPDTPLAADLGCGEGRDSRELARRGWSVIAIDSSSDGLGRLAASLPKQPKPRVIPVLLGLDAVPIAFTHLTGLDLVNASFALPFCDPSHFPALWNWIVHSLRTGGRFAGQFFGDRDDWASIRPASHYTRPAVENLLAPFHIEHFEEVDKDGSDAMGGNKHHHVFHVVARKAAHPA